MKRSSLFQAMHLLWVDEHNRLAKEIEKLFPEKSDEVKKFQNDFGKNYRNLSNFRKFREFLKL